nr:hypothetical protein [Tanacetum cinerariifolium]
MAVHRNFFNDNTSMEGYKSDVYLDDEEEEDENNHSNGNVVKRGITRLSKFHREYGKPDVIKLSVTFDALNRISGSYIALFLSFLRDLVCEHIGLEILFWKKVGSEVRDKLWDEIMQYFDVDLTFRKLVMNRLGQLLRNFKRKFRQTYILPNQDTLSKINDVSAKYSAILKAEEWVNFVKYMTTKEYQKQTEDKIKEGTLKVDHDTDAMTVVLGKEKEGYTRGVGSEVTYKSADEEGKTPLSVVGCENDASIQKSNGLATSEKKMETRETVNSVGSKKTTKSL